MDFRTRNLCSTGWRGCVLSVLRLLSASQFLTQGELVSLLIKQLYSWFLLQLVLLYPKRLPSSLQT